MRILGARMKTLIQRRTRIGTFLLCAVLSAAIAPASGQTTSGALHGVIADSAGAPMAEVSIEIREQDTGAVRKSATNAEGFYAARELQPGQYTVSAFRQGFAAATSSRIELSVNQDLEVSFALGVAGNAQTIEVRDSALAIDTTDGTVGTVVSGQQVVDLPLNGRQFTQLILLTPGAVAKQANQQTSFVVPLGAAGISPAVNGQRPQQNDFTIDGVSNNAIFNNTWAVSPPPDAIQEFRVQSHITDAQFGNSPGANVNVAIRSGSNSYHGAAWEYLRNDALDSANYFTNAVGQTKNPYRQNQYGITFGGPILLPRLYDGKRHKTYVFGYWENFSARQDQTDLLNVPSPVQLTGNFSAVTTPIYNPFSAQTAGSSVVRAPFPGNIIPPSPHQSGFAGLSAGVLPRAQPNYRRFQLCNRGRHKKQTARNMGPSWIRIFPAAVGCQWQSIPRM